MSLPLPDEIRPDAMALLRGHVLGDGGLTAELAAIAEPDAFAARIGELANGLGLALDEAAVRQAIQPDPLGLARFMAAAATERGWPPPGFLPVHAGATGVDWACFGARRLTEPFFQDSIRKALQRPFNRLFPWRMAWSDFVAGAAGQRDVIRPDGFIFHMSRCGSTLVAQMLARSARNIVVSEAAPIDAAVQYNNADALRAMVAAYGRPRGASETRLFIKLDSWHALALPLFAQAFPGVPWIFLYRDPLEVMVSQQREPGAQMVPGFVMPAIPGLDDATMTAGPDYTARVLNLICTAAADALRSPQGLAVNYRDLPDAFERRILPHFGVVADDAERAQMRDAARYDAKRPSSPFAADSAAKQAAASAVLRDAAARHLGNIVPRLDALAGRSTRR